MTTQDDDLHVAELVSDALAAEGIEVPVADLVAAIEVAEED